ncbi:hypothetical protein [Chroococcidiopsis sp.]
MLNRSHAIATLATDARCGICFYRLNIRSQIQLVVLRFSIQTI